VCALEKTETARLARHIVRLNGLADRITVVHAAVETAILPEPVDVIVSEWLGAIGVDENLLAPLLLARDRWLRQAGRMLPESVTSLLAPVSDAHTAASGGSTAAGLTDLISARCSPLGRTRRRGRNRHSSANA
jgi:hypothetical protein